MARSVVLILLLAFVIRPASAQSVANIEEAWRDWMTGHGRTAGGLAVLHAGQVVHQATMGRVSARTRVPVASLSKAVTAVCVAGLIESGKLSFDMPLARATPRTIARLGAPADPRLLDVTLGQLLTHRAGYDRSTGDPATGNLSTYLRGATATRTAFDDRLRTLFRQKLPLSPGERFAYTNATYLILGAVIEEASGQDYETFCRQTVLAPLGVESAALEPSWRILSSFGGWSMTLADYGRFYQAFAPRNAALGPAARRWMLSPDGKSVGTGIHYGLGTNVRLLEGGQYNVWHWGRWTYSLNPAYDGQLAISYATFAVRWGRSDASIALYMEPDLPNDGPAASELDRAMSKAVGAVTRWP